MIGGHFLPHLIFDWRVNADQEKEELELVQPERGMQCFWRFTKEPRCKCERPIEIEIFSERLGAHNHILPVRKMVRLRATKKDSTCRLTLARSTSRANQSRSGR